MSQITIDRELLRHVLDEYFQEWAEARAYFGMVKKIELHRPDLRDAVQQCFAIHKEEKRKALAEDDGITTRLRETLRDEDDEGFLYALKARFPA
jgi:hypothetical protein